MARPLAALERFFERLFERPAARVFRTRLHPVQLQRRLERAMESDRRLAAQRTYVPNRYRIRLHPDDLAAFEAYRGTLETELADSLLARARSRGYSFVEHPRVTLHGADDVSRGDIEVEAEVVDPLMMRPAPAGFQRVADAGDPAPDEPADPTPRADATAVFQVPAAAVAPVTLHVRTRDDPERVLAVTGARVRIGRAADNDIVLQDDRVSRHHGQLNARQGTLVYTDLGSTNGSFVNGAPVTEVALGSGDVLQLGDTRVAVDAG